MAIKEKALRRLADKLNAAGVVWAIGGDWLLCQKGLADTYHEFELVVAEADAAKADKVLSKLGMRSEMAGAMFGAAYHFDGADIHVRAGISGFSFDQSAVGEDVTVLGATVHLLAPAPALALAELDGKNIAAWEKYASSAE